MKYLIFLFILVTTNTLACMELETKSKKFVRVYKIDTQPAGKFWILDEFSISSTTNEQIEPIFDEAPKATSDDQSAKQYSELFSKLYIIICKWVAS